MAEPLQAEHELDHRLTAILLFAVAYFLFSFTSMPGITVEDSAELAGGARFLTMVHAPGYPLYLLVGHLIFPLSNYPGQSLVLFSAFMGALTVSLVFLGLRPRLGRGPAAGAALALLFCDEFWQVSTEIEVYSLQALLLVSLFILLLKWQEKPNGRTLRLIGFIAGISLTHHIGILIHLPAVFLFIAFTGWSSVKLKDVCAAAGYMVLALMLYATLMILSAREGMPVISWLPIDDLKMLIHVATGAGFKRQAFGVPWDEVARNLLTFPLILLFWFPLLALPGIAAGFVQFYKKNPAFGVLLVAMVLLTIFQAATYDVLDPERFLIPAIVPIVFTCAWGFEFFLERYRPKSGTITFLLLALLFSAVAGKFMSGRVLMKPRYTQPLDVSRSILDFHDNTFGTDSSVIWADWHYFPTLRYVQLAEGSGAHVEVFMDSTITTPDGPYLDGRTYVTVPSRELGERFFLTMENFHWRLDEDTPAEMFSTLQTDGTPRSMIDTSFGIILLTVDTPAWITPGEPIAVTLHYTAAPEFRNGRPNDRPDSTSSDTRDTLIAGYLHLLRNGSPRLRTPFQLARWHIHPTALPGSLVTTEHVEILLPTSHKLDPPETTYELLLEFASDSVLLGPFEKQ